MDHHKVKLKMEECGEIIVMVNKKRSQNWVNTFNLKDRVNISFVFLTVAKQVG